MTDTDNIRIENLSQEMKELREQFQKLNNRILELEQGADGDYSGLRKTEIISSRLRLMRNYRTFAILGAGMMFTVPGILMNGHIFQELRTPENIILAILFAAYFLLCSIMDIFLYKKLSGINPADMSMKEISLRAYSVRHTHHIFMCILIPYAIGLVSFFAYALRADIFILLGMAAGGIIGGLIGYTKYRKMMKDYKKIIIL